jgi:hypothetical protein
MTVTRYTPEHLWVARRSSKEVYVHASHYDALAARLAEALRLLAQEGIHMDDHGCWCEKTPDSATDRESAP